MYININNKTVINTKDIIGIFNIKDYMQLSAGRG